MNEIRERERGGINRLETLRRTVRIGYEKLKLYVFTTCCSIGDWLSLRFLLKLSEIRFNLPVSRESSNG